MESSNRKYSPDTKTGSGAVESEVGSWNGTGDGVVEPEVESWDGTGSGVVGRGVVGSEVESWEWNWAAWAGSGGGPSVEAAAQFEHCARAYLSLLQRALLQSQISLDTNLHFAATIFVAEAFFFSFFFLFFF